MHSESHRDSFASSNPRDSFLSNPRDSFLSNPRDRDSFASAHTRDSYPGANRRSWLNNVLNNNYESSSSPSSSITTSSPSSNFLAAPNKENENGDKKLRIESLLNSGNAAEAQNNERVKLPHVDKLGIDMVLNKQSA